MSVITCGKEPQDSLKIMVTFDIIIALIFTIIHGMIGSTLLFFPHSHYAQEYMRNYSNFDVTYKENIIKNNSIKGIGIFLLVIMLVAFLVNVYLYDLICSGMRNNSFRKCRRWFIIRILLLLFSLMTTLPHYLYFDNKSLPERILLYVKTSFYTYDVFELIVAQLYLRDMKGYISSPEEV